MVKWFHRLGVSWKLMLIGVLFMIPDGIMLYLSITEINQNIAVARLEQTGNRYQRPLERLLDLVPRHRLLAREALAGDVRAQVEQVRVAAEVDRAFDALEAVDRQVGADLGFTPAGLASRNRQGCDPRSVRQEWVRLNEPPAGTGSGRDACDRGHLRVIADMRTMIAQAGDVSNLILDPDIDSYYLVDGTLLALPQTQDRLSQVMADGADLLRAGGDADQRTSLAIGLSDVREHDLSRIVASTGISLNDNRQGAEMGGVCRTLQARVPAALADYVGAAERFDGLTQRVLDGTSGSGSPGGVTVAEFLAAGTAARDASLRYWWVAADQLDALLQARIDAYAWRRTRSMGVAGLALVAAAGLVSFITRSINTPLRRRAEQALIEGEAWFARIVSNVPGMVFQYTLGPDGRAAFTFVGDGARDLYGLEPDVIRADATAPFKLCLPDDLPPFLAGMAESAASGAPLRREWRIRHTRTGAVRWLAVAARPERRADGGTVWDGVVTDVTAIKVAEAAADAAAASAAAASVAKSDFLANMSHEIRTPLNGVVGMVDLLQQTPLNARQQRYAQVIHSSSDALLSLINDILDFSKIEAGKMELEEVDFDPNGTVEDVVAVLAQKAAGKGLLLACDVDGAVPPRVRGDGDRLRQVVTNLVNNAIKFTAAGEVVVRVSLAEEVPQVPAGELALRFEVTDTGIGIPPDRLDRLFKSFSQVDSSTTRKYGGTGLGLAICKQLVELMGGTIGVRSEPGRGSTFWFTAVFRRPAAAAAGPARAGPLSLGDRQVLVADANPTQRRILQNQLASWGARVTMAATGEAAVDLLRAAAAAGRPFAAALVDADLPDLSGASVAVTIRAEPSLASLPLILTSGVRSGVDPADAGRLGFARGLAKPIRQSSLYDAVIAAVATVATDRPTTAEPASAPEPPPPGVVGPARILLAEDVEVNQFIATEVLARAGYACDIANNGREAVEAVARRSYELVLMDCQMPEMSGFEAAAAIRAREQRPGADGGRVPIIALTANALKGDRERCVAAGMDDYMTKPLNPAQLIQTIAARIGPGTPPAAGEAARAA